MIQPLVSIVTPSFNQADFIEETLCSVLEQDYPRIEYIVIDGGSTDGSVEIIRKYADRLAYWVSERDAGQSDAINKGLRRATGDIVAWLNSDDYYVPHALTAAVQCLVAHPEAGMVYGNVDVVDAHGQVLKRGVGSDYDLARQLLQEIIVPQPAAFWWRRVTEDVGYLRTDLHYAMDWDLWLRIGRRYSIHHLRRSLAVFRRSGVNKTAAHPDRIAGEVTSILDDLYRDAQLRPALASLKHEVYGAAYLGGANGAIAAYDFKSARRWLLRAVRTNPAIVAHLRCWLVVAKIMAGAPGRRATVALRDLRRRKVGAKAGYRDPR